jgi:hypothetical protein
MTLIRTKILLPFLFGIFCSQFVIGQTYSTLISDKEIYDFLNYITKTDKKHREEPFLKCKQIYYKIHSWDSANFKLKDTAFNNKFPFYESESQYLFYKGKGVDTMFKQEDRAFIFNQFTSIKDSIWHDPFCHSKLLKDKNQKRPNRYYYSIPLFSIDNNYVVIAMSYYCGSLCAYGGYYIYKKIGKNRWEYVVAINTWVS